VPYAGCIPQGNLALKDIFNALYVSFVDYLAGRKSGLYWPSLPPTYQKKHVDTNNSHKMDYFSIMKDELMRQCVRKRAGMSLI